MQLETALHTERFARHVERLCLTRTIENIAKEMYLDNIAWRVPEILEDASNELTDLVRAMRARLLE